MTKGKISITSNKKLKKFWYLCEEFKNKRFDHAPVLLNLYVPTTPPFKSFLFIVAQCRDLFSKNIITRAWKLKDLRQIQSNFHSNSIQLIKYFAWQNKHYFCYYEDILKSSGDILYKVHMYIEKSNKQISINLI